MKEVMFVIPFAGGSSHSFLNWQIPEDFEFVYIDMPGKGTREGQARLNDFWEMAEEGCAQIEKYRKEHSVDRYFLWGHSLGSYLAFEMTRLFFLSNALRPACLILSGTIPPECMDHSELEEKLRDEEQFLEYIVSFGHVSRKIACSSFFQKKYLPYIKSDYGALAQYRECSGILKSQPVLILNGRDDEMTKDDAGKWSIHFDAEPEFRWFSGDHFFILERLEEIISTLKDFMKNQKGKNER